MTTPTTYAVPIARALGAALLAALVVSVVDATSAVGGHGARAITVIVALYMLPALAVGVLTGLVLGAVDATFGPEAIRRGLARIRDDADRDRDVCAWIIAAATTGLMFAGFVAVGSLVLVGGVERKEVGAVLFGLVAAAALPTFFLVSLPVYRLARRVAMVIPRIGPVPASFVLVGTATVVIVLAVITYAATNLDTKALSLGFLFHLVLFFAIFKIWIAASASVLSPALARLPRRGPIVFAMSAIALIASLFIIRGPLSIEANAGIEKHGGLSQMLLSFARRLSDADGDGYSALLSGPDCDDSRADVNPGPNVVDIPGNGIDENCYEGDAAPGTSSLGQDQEPAPSQAEKLAKHRRPKANLLFIAIDTLRSDRLGVNGYKRDGQSLTPAMDKLAQESAHFRQAYAQAPNTPRSFPSFFTSRLPSQVSVDKSFRNYSVVLPENLTVWESLQQAGIRTIGFSTHFYFKEDRGIRQGFDEYDNEGAKNIAGSNKDIASPRTVPKVLARLNELGQSKQRFAMFVHLFEPHSSYMTHPEYPITTRGVDSLIQKYDYEIRFTDGWLKKLLAGLDDAGLADDTIVVLLSDHGEAFGVHRVAGKRMFFHGQTLYDELLRVPLLFRVPGLEPVVNDQSVMLIDVAPTILDILDVPRPKEFSGRSLLPAMAKAELVPRPAFAELIPAPSWNRAARMVVGGDGQWKLLYQTTEKRYELYDLNADPQERNNLFKDPEASSTEQVQALRSVLSRWIETGQP